MNREKLKEIVPIFLKMKDSDDFEISKAIEKLGLSVEDSERISAFIPSAFCRIALSHHIDVEFPNSYKVEGLEGEYSYNDEPIYILGIELASVIYHNEPELAEVFNSIVTRSAECNVINNALNEGAELAGASLSATNYFGYDTLGKKHGALSEAIS
ncbi:hypothetical protein [Vibrio ostreicida]|uniref:hypothetical protein n=1 Tax=Vibrio ostreicida TaxID=526588 RepID=UPI0009710502|nr:hypothetical protein [Vibrio ostreicida]